MDTTKLFNLAEKLDNAIASLEGNVFSYEDRCELADLKAYREHVQKGIESAIASMESSTGE
jgi:uncharacterized protein YdcH (DUF465 family)